MKNIYVGLLAAVACTYSMQAAANSLNCNNINLVFKGDDFSLTAPFASHTAIPIGLKPISSLESAVKLAAVCSVGGGGCSGLSFGSSDNSMDLDKNFQCTDEGFVKTCPSGYVKDDNNLCPHNKSYFKCRPCNSSCDSGYSLTACNSTTQVQTASYKTECGSTCYQCRYKTCAEGGYSTTPNSCQNGTAVSFANQTCYKDVTAKTCENGGYKSSIPTNNKCDSTTYCSKTCYTNCKQPTCEESGFLSTCPTNHTCDTVTSGTYGRTCYKDKGQPTCEDGGYKSGVPTNQVCTPVSYSGRTCYQNCYQPQCSAGGYLDACPTNQSGTSVTYYGRNCVKDCSDDPGAVCKAAGYTATSCDKFMTAENCPSDSNYKKCTHTCGSRIFADNPTYNIDGQGSYSNPVNVITKNGTYLGSSATTYSNINFPQYAECKALPKPVITLNAAEYSPGTAPTSISGNRIENIDFVINYTPYTKPKACDYLYILKDWNGGTFCFKKQNSSYSNYAVYDSSSYCKESGICVDDCYNSSSYNYNSYECGEYRQATEELEEYSGYSLCQWLNSNYNNSCQVSSSSATSAVKLDPSGRTTSTYTCDGKSSTKYSATMYLKNVNITVNGSPKIGVVIGGGAHYESTIIFEGTNKITGGSAHAVWVRGHNTCSYGKVKGILQVSSGATLTLGKPACIYTGWNGVLNKYGTISGTVTTNCSTYPLKW